MTLQFPGSETEAFFDIVFNPDLRYVGLHHIDGVAF